MLHLLNPRCRLALATLALLAAGSPCFADPELRIPDFSNLRAKAVDSTDITVDGFLLRLARQFAAKAAEDDPEAAAAADVLKDIKSVNVRSFTFADDDAYSKADIDSVRRQLSGPGWSAVVSSHRRDPAEDVDVFINTDGEKILGLAVVASEAREFTIVNVVGNIDVDKFARLEGQFGIPRVSTND